MMVNVQNLINRDTVSRRPLVTVGDVIAAVAVVAVLIGSAVVGGLLAWVAAVALLTAVAVIGGAR